MSTISLVRQEHCSGCGPACVAMIAGTNYSAALEAMWPGKRRGFGSSYDDVRRALLAFGVCSAHGGRVCTSFTRVHELSIVRCRYSERTGMSHWVVFDPDTGTLFDPLKSSPVRTDATKLDRRLRPFSRLGAFRWCG